MVAIRPLEVAATRVYVVSGSFHAFADDRSLGIGRLTIENSADRVAIYGDIDFQIDAVSLERARDLKTIVDSVVMALEQASTLPERAVAAPVTDVANPFQGESSGGKTKG